MSLAEDFARAKALKEQLRALEESISRRANASRITIEDERRMSAMQSRADSVYSELNRRAPPPLPLERPEEYRRRLASGLQPCSPRWREADLSAVSEDALNVIESQIFEDARADSIHPHDLRPSEMRELTRTLPGGHTTVEFRGGENTHFVQQFNRPARRAAFKGPDEYARMSRDLMLSRVEQVMRRPRTEAPRASF
jgi:hypothetical protein